MKLSFFIFLTFLSITAVSQVKIENYKIYDKRSGKTCTIEEMINDLSGADVVFFGEEHNDPTGHQLETEALKMLHQKNGSKQVLSMEMFETDIQQVINEYLQNLIREKNFTKEARSWSNYTDYRPMVEYSREQHLPVIAANTPNRYVNIVTRKGLASLDSLDKTARKWLPPLPVDTAAGKYYENFLKTMGGHKVPGMEIYQAQNLWDSGMAYSIYHHLKKNKVDKVFHVVGRFHSDEKLGTVAKLLKFKPSLKAANISCFSDSTFRDPDWAKFSHLGDYVIITNPEIKRTY
ncbi:MAG: ChaN family lipoprotein [Pedobacter sp.]|jgi:uncharacterized iron-regulated protein